MIFITLQEVIDAHEVIIRLYGGLNGIRDLGLLISAIEMPKAAVLGSYLHPTSFDQAAAYLFHIVCNHPFLDGNKRTGVVTALTFLRRNGVYIGFSAKQMDAFEELVVGTAQSKITKRQLADFLAGAVVTATEEHNG